MPQGSVIGNHHEIELVRPDVPASSLFRSGEPRPCQILYVLPCSQACRLEREMTCFDYGAAAELFPGRHKTRMIGAVTYKRLPQRGKQSATRLRCSRPARSWERSSR